MGEFQALKAFRILQPGIDAVLADKDIPLQSLMYALGMHALTLMEHYSPESAVSFPKLLAALELTPPPDPERPEEQTKTQGEEPKPS